MCWAQSQAVAVSARGDANADGAVEVSDVFFLINYLFAGGSAPIRSCLADSNSDAAVTAADVFFLINHMFGGGTAPALQPPEVCNSADDDCDGAIDESGMIFYRDADNDTYGNPLMSGEGCSAPSGYVDRAGDCNDGNPAVNPAAVERCNGDDENCDARVDEGFETVGMACDGVDNDACLEGMIRCTAAGDGVECSDSSSSTSEICNGADDDCDGAIDDGAAASCPIRPATGRRCSSGLCEYECVLGWQNCGDSFDPICIPITQFCP